MEGIIKFELNHKFVKINCLERENGNLCPFLECEGKTFKCINYTPEGVALYRELMQYEKNHLVKQGCDYIIQKFLKKKNHLKGKRVEYSDGSNMNERKVIYDLVNKREKNKFTILIKAKNDIKPYPVPIDGNYLSITKHPEKGENGTITINNDLGFGNSIDIYM